MSNTCERSSSDRCAASASRAGWYRWFGFWPHINPMNSIETYAPPYFIGTARELCFSQGLETGDPLCP